MDSSSKNTKSPQKDIDQKDKTAAVGNNKEEMSEQINTTSKLT